MLDATEYARLVELTEIGEKNRDDKEETELRTLILGLLSTN